MTCASCVNHVQRALQSLNGVSKVSVNFATETASVDFDA
ncbi:MAG: heavy-metal-associated domain-containing protein, partial [Nitrospirota bacterium]|nr:heavy-metal-associated domain-containing protein [Nitrospirota bacterium]